MSVLEPDRTFHQVLMRVSGIKETVCFSHRFEHVGTYFPFTVFKNKLTFLFGNNYTTFLIVFFKLLIEKTCPVLSRFKDFKNYKLIFGFVSPV